MPDIAANAPQSAVTLPPADDWRTSDQDEVNRRRLRAREEAPRIVNRDERFPIFSNFEVHSPSGVTYVAEILDLASRQFSCECVDFRVNGLRTCKHVEAVLDHLERDRPVEYAAGLKNGSPRIDLTPDRECQNLRVERGLERLPRTLRRLFDHDGRLSGGYLPEMALELVSAARNSPRPAAPPGTPAGRLRKDRGRLRRGRRGGGRARGWRRRPRRGWSAPRRPG